MAWRFPRWRELDGYPCDMEAVNQDIEATVEEVEGLLNEHNWAFNGMTSTDNMTAGAVVRMASTHKTVNPVIGAGDPPPTAIIADGFQVSTNTDWVVIDDMVRTVTTDTANLWIMASFQQQPSTPASDSVRLGSQYGIRIDGVLLWETVLGGGDRSNDIHGEGFGGNATCIPVVLDAVLPVIAGDHRVEIVARTPRNEAFTVPSSDDYWMVLNRELIIVELY